MTAHSLIIAVAIGVMTGFAGRLLVGRRRVVPVWLPVAAGVAAAVLATVLAWTAEAVRPGSSGLTVFLQVLFAAAGVTAVAVTADRPERSAGNRGDQAPELRIPPSGAGHPVRRGPRR